MISIRNNVFETNSSSVHNFVLSKENTISSKPKNIDLSIKNDALEYGWDFTKYTQPKYKLAYLLALVYYLELKGKIYHTCSRYRDNLPARPKNDIIFPEEKNLVYKHIQKYNETIDHISQLLASKNVTVDFSKIGIRKITEEDIKIDEKFYCYCELPVICFIDHVECAKYFYNKIIHSDKNILNWIFGKSFFLTGTDNAEEEEIKWTLKNLKTKFPCEHYAKDN